MWPPRSTDGDRGVRADQGMEPRHERGQRLGWARAETGVGESSNIYRRPTKFAFRIPHSAFRSPQSAATASQHQASSWQVDMRGATEKKARIDWYIRCRGTYAQMHLAGWPCGFIWHVRAFGLDAFAPSPGGEYELISICISCDFGFACCWAQWCGGAGT